ncbi:MAG: CDP-archaeol synthase [Gammaproteobacteria bacterium]
MHAIQLVLVLIVANGAPIVARKVFGARLAVPLDGNRVFADGRPILGSSKTVRGVAAALLATPPAAVLLGLPAQVGLTVAFFAMVGDALASFAKRRLDIPVSGRCLGLDQIPESLLPALALQAPLALGALEITAVVAGFIVSELALSRVLFQLNIRDRPY